MHTGEPNVRPPSSSSSALDRELDKFYAQVNIERTLQTPEADTAVLATQLVIAQRFDNEVVAPREQIWDDTTALLKGRYPHVECDPLSKHSPYLDFRLRWMFKETDTRRAIQLTASAATTLRLTRSVTETVWEPSTPKFSEYGEIGQAVGYLCRGTLKGRQTPDELLGVKAEGKGRAKILSTDGLIDKLVSLTLEPDTSLQPKDGFNIKVVASTLGNEGEESEAGHIEKRLVDLSGFTPSSETSEDLKLLRPDQVKGVYDAWWSGDTGVKPTTEPTLDDIYRYLETRYLQDGVGEQYRQLDIANQAMLRISNPGWLH